VALFIGLVCSLKFPLAYVCGRRLIDSRFGLLWALAMFAPGWASLEALVFLNPNAVAAAALLVLWVALECLEPARDWPMFAALGFVLALAIHVHPTSAPVFLLAAIVFWARHRRHGSLAAPMLAMIVAFLLPFVPYFYAEIRGGFADWGSASTYLSKQVVPVNVTNAPAVIADYVFAGPKVVAEYFLHWKRGLASALGALAALAACLPLAALLEPRARRWLAIFAGALLVFAVWIACMRPTTPFQFTWMLCPVVGALVAVGLWSLDRRPALRAAVWAACVASVALNLWVLHGMAARVLEGEGRLPSRVMDIKDRIPRTVFQDVWFPAYAHERLGRILCDAGGKVALHGHLAYVVDKDLGLDALFACDDRSRLSLAGSRSPSHILGMTNAFWTALNAEPACRVGSLGLTRRMTPLLERAPIALADGSTYMPRQLNRKPPEETALSFEAPRGAAVLVTNVLGDYEPFRVLAAHANGQRIDPAAQNDFSSLYAPRIGEASVVQWTLAIVATNPHAVEAAAIEFGAQTSTPHASDDCRMSE